MVRNSCGGSSSFGLLVMVLVSGVANVVVAVVALMLVKKPTSTTRTN